MGMVGGAQTKLSASTKADVRARAAASSLRLILESETVRASADGYIKALSGVVEVKRAVFFETLDMAQCRAWVHRNYLAQLVLRELFSGTKVIRVRFPMPLLRTVN